MEIMIGRTALLLFVLFLSACSSWYRSDFDPVKYEGVVIHTSDLNAHVRMNTGDVNGYPPATMIYVDPLFTPRILGNPETYGGIDGFGPAYNFTFGLEDQETFLTSMNSELLKHGIVESVNEVNIGEVLEVVINFVETKCETNLSPECRIEALLLLKFGEITHHEIYSIVSSRGESALSFLATHDLSTAKSKAAEKLLAAIIPDIEKFISQLPN